MWDARVDGRAGIGRVAAREPAATAPITHPPTPTTHPPTPTPPCAGCPCAGCPGAAGRRRSGCSARGQCSAAEAAVPSAKARMALSTGLDDPPLHRTTSQPPTASTAPPCTPSDDHHLQSRRRWHPSHLAHERLLFPTRIAQHHSESSMPLGVVVGGRAAAAASARRWRRRRRRGTIVSVAPARLPPRRCDGLDRHSRGAALRLWQETAIHPSSGCRQRRVALQTAWIS